MGRPSKAKLLEITLKLQQNLCANCSIPLTEINEKIAKISHPYSQTARKATKVNLWPNKEMSLSEALLTVFEAAFKMNKVTISTDTILYMCKQCASSLSELYWTYKTFLEITKQESYIRAAIKTCLLWKEEDSSEALEESPHSNTKPKDKSHEKTNPGKATRSSETAKKDLESFEDNSEIDSDQFYDDPNDEDYLPEAKSVEAVSTLPTKKCKTERRKQATPMRRKLCHDEQSTESNAPIKRTTRSTRKCKDSKGDLRKKTVIKKANLKIMKKSKNKVKKIYRKRSAHCEKKQSYERNLCRICNKKFESSTLLKTHSIKCKKVLRSSVCRYCGKKFSLKLLRDRHESVFHSKELCQKGENLSCKECGKTFKNLTFLRRHASVHSSAKPFQCETCLKSFKRFDTLQEHQRVKSHTLSLGPKSRPLSINDAGTKTYPCKICNQVFKHKVSLFRHESKLHMEERPFGCEKCWKRYRNKDKLANHLKTAHENRKEKERVIYKCDLCENKTYTYFYSYKAHMVTHVIDKPFLCSQCGNSFRQKQGFLRHMSTMHKPENRHTCSVCGKSFKRKDHLTQHLRGKTHGKPPKDKKSKQVQETISNITSHTTNQINDPPKSCQSASLTMSTTLTNVDTGYHRTTAIIVEAPPSLSSHFSQPNIVRPGVIVPASHSTTDTHNIQSNENTNQSGQPSSFTFSASNLFFDF